MKVENIIEHICKELDFNNGQLFDLTNFSLNDILKSDWLDKGEWLTSAKKAGAEKIFFVENNPVVVFAKCCNNREDKISCFNKLWSLARPRILFLEHGCELSVIDLAQEPVPENDEERKVMSIELLKDIRNVAEKLQDYHRDNIESGKVFENGRFGDLRHRADQSLITDLKTVRKELIAKGLDGEKLKYSHSLIGRSIFIRYLEDRGILTYEYFEKVASKNEKWMSFIKKSFSRDHRSFSEPTSFYPIVLEDKSFAYAFFKSLSKDFNGDMFPNIEQEENNVQIEHLKLIQDLLYGDVGIQKKLFFFSYKFDIIPLDLISSIYEIFYHSASNEKDLKNKARQDGAYYTPPVLAEFVLSRVLTEKDLEKNPRVLDPACGSGIFLVEAFRRMVRYKWREKNVALDFNELKEMLGSKILGIEINEEAARITAFSLYLAMLHYIDPPSIQKHILSGNKLPNLLASGQKSSNHFHSIRVANAFAVSKEDLGEVNIVVGNPPWGAPQKPDSEVKHRQKIMLDWCKLNLYPIGDNEPSQAFLWRAVDFLKEGGKCALLTSSGVLLNISPTTQLFRKEWMKNICLDEVFNFIHVRKFFFKGADSPFMLINFKKGKQGSTPVEYWSAKQVVALKETQAVLFSKYDRNYLVNQDLTDNKTWKTNWFGRNSDVLLLKKTGEAKKLLNFIDREKSGQGYKKSPAEDNYPEVSRLKSLSQRGFSRYDDLEFSISPEKFHRAGVVEAYFGKRLLIKRGIIERNESKGEIVARFETKDFCYTNAINGLKLKDDCVAQYKLFLGIIWSSFSRYYFFNTTANWGVWHHEIHLNDELLQLPIPNIDDTLAVKIISIVDKLRNYKPEVRNVVNPKGVPKEEIEINRRKWEKELDEAVFDLYGFSDEERDLIRDCCEVTMPFFYQPYDSVGAMKAIENEDVSWIKHYVEIFAERWNPYLNKDEVLRADVHIGASENMVAVEFYPADVGDGWDLVPKNKSWNYILEEIGKVLPRPMGTSQIILDGVVHAISNDAIIIIKRNEKRFWTRSSAREDASSTLCKRMIETMPHLGNIE